MEATKTMRIPVSLVGTVKRLKKKRTPDLRVAAKAVIKAWVAPDNDVVLQRAMDRLKAALE